MPCFRPLDAFRPIGSVGGRFSFGLPPAHRRALYVSLKLPCGQCYGCRIDRSQQWAARIMHEASLYSDNSFLTLTYAPEYVPAGRSLYYRDFQLFMKRLKKRLANRSIRFYMCGEYGDNYGRPHYHAILFDIDFPDKELFKVNRQGDPVYKSKFLTDTWGLGHVTFGGVSFESAAYVARYVCKKITGNAELVQNHYQYFDLQDGQIYSLVPEFANMSRKPGIGKAWLDKFASDVYPDDFVLVKGRKARVPRFYDKNIDPNILLPIKEKRIKRAKRHKDNNTPERLAVREAVLKARLVNHKREEID